MRPSSARPMKPLALAAVALAIAASPKALLAQSATPVQGDSASVAGVVEHYDRALAAGDSAAALGLLAPDAVILESGGLKTREEYRSHHLASDIGFARTAREARGRPRPAARSARSTAGQWSPPARNSWCSRERRMVGRSAPSTGRRGLAGPGEADARPPVRCASSEVTVHERWTG